MISITLRQLHYFDALARLGHFGRAAQACAISQPVLSMQIRQHELELGTALIERSRRGVVLTEAGREVAPRAAASLADAQRSAEHARTRGKVLSGRLHFGLIPTVAPYLLPLLLPRLRASFPDLELHVRETRTAVLLAELAAAVLDVVLAALPIADPDLDSLELIEDRFVLAAPRDHRRKGRVVVTEDLLRRERLLLLEEGHCFREQALSYCSLQQSTGLSTLGASSFATIVRMVANGLGITFLPEMALATEVRNREVRIMRLPAPEPARTLGLVWRGTSPRKRDLAALGRLIGQR